MRQPARRVLGGVLTTVALLGALLSAAGSVTAVGTAPCRPSSVDRDIAKADVVFRGVVTKSRPLHGTGAQRTRSYKVAADRVYKSSLVTTSVLVTARVRPGPCTLPKLVKGTHYLFFVNERGPQLMATTATSEATKRLTHQVVKRLGSGAQPTNSPPVPAELTKVADANPPGLARLLAPGAAVVILSLLGLLVVSRLGRRTA